MSESKYGKYIITELNAPDFGPEKTAQYARFRGGMAHCPLRLLKVGQPIFHFTVVNSGLYKIDFKEK